MPEHFFHEEDKHESMTSRKAITLLRSYLLLLSSYLFTLMYKLQGKFVLASILWSIFYFDWVCFIIFAFIPLVHGAVWFKLFADLWFLQTSFRNYDVKLVTEHEVKLVTETNWYEMHYKYFCYSIPNLQDNTKLG